MKKVWAGSLGLVAAAVIVAGIVFAEPGQGTGAAASGRGYCNGCGMNAGGGMGGGTGRIYDPAKAETISGQVVSLEQIAGRRGMGTGVVLKVSSGSDTFVVHLGPKWYLDDQKVKFAAGDAVEIKGVRTVRRGQDIFLAAEIKKGSDILKLRDEQGIPLWAGWRRTENRS